MFSEVELSVVGWSVVNWNEGLGNRVSIIMRIYIYIYIYNMKFAAYMAVSFATFFHIPLVHFLSSYVWLHILYTSDYFFKLCIFLLCLCIFIITFMYFIIMFMYTYCYVFSVLGFLFHCVVRCIVGMKMGSVLLPPGVNPNAVKKIYHIIS